MQHSSKEYGQALDQTQATEQLNVATQNAGEAQERFNDVQQNFWLGLVPTIVSAGGTLTGVFSKLGGEGGIGGLAGKFTSMGSVGGRSIGSLVTAFGPLTLVIAAAGGAAAILIDTLQKGGELKSLIAISNRPGSTIQDVQNSIGSLQRWRDSIEHQLTTGIKGVTPFGNLIPDVTGEVMKSLESKEYKGSLGGYK